jgi:ribonuclease VapC
VIVDSSALIAIVRREAEADRFIAVLGRARQRKLSAASYLESAIVIDSARNPVFTRRFDELVEASQLVVEPVTVEQAAVARAAYRDFGKGSGHPAQLNFGDCFAYALSAVSREPLLYKGDDFTRAGVRSAAAES